MKQLLKVLNIKSEKSFREGFIFVILLDFFLCTGSVQAQEVVTGCGDFYSNASNSVSFTLGEPVSETYKGTNNILTQGLNQPLLTVGAIHESPGMNYTISAFPNPASQFIKIKIEKGKVKGMNLAYQLMDMNGKILQQKKLEVIETEISVKNLPPAAYFLKVVINDNEIKTFTLIKH